jgi:signal peptidase I
MRKDQRDPTSVPVFTKAFMSAAEDTPADAANAAKCALASETLRQFGSLQIKATGTSMLPAVWPGDTLRVEKAAIGQLLPGDIAVYGRDGRIFAHRVIAIEKNTREISALITQGDAMPHRDSAVSSEELLGKVTRLARAGKNIEPRRTLTRSGRLVSFLARHSQWVTRILLFSHTQRRTPRERIALCEN